VKAAGQKLRTENDEEAFDEAFEDPDKIYMGQVLRIPPLDA
jgi:nucleoid-associated protein YgaU